MNGNASLEELRQYAEENLKTTHAFIDLLELSGAIHKGVTRSETRKKLWLLWHDMVNDQAKLLRALQTGKIPNGRTQSRT